MKREPGNKHKESRYILSHLSNRYLGGLFAKATSTLAAGMLVRLVCDEDHRFDSGNHYCTDTKLRN